MCIYIYIYIYIYVGHICGICFVQSSDNFFWLLPIGIITVIGIISAIVHIIICYVTYYLVLYMRYHMTYYILVFMFATYRTYQQRPIYTI